MTITKHPVNGAWVCSDIVNGYVVSMTYYGHTKREAQRRFRALCRKEKSK